MHRQRWLPAFLVLSLIWGSRFALIRIGVTGGFTPPWVAAVRCGLGMLTLLVIMVVMGHRIPWDVGLWGHSFVAGALLNTIPVTMLALGERQVGSTVAGLWNATAPLVTLGCGMVLVRSRPSTYRVLGLFLGFVGALLVLRVWRGFGGPLTLGGNLACLCASASLGVSFCYIRRFQADSPESGIVLAVAQAICSAAQTAILAVCWGGRLGHPTGSAWSALLVLGVFSGGLAILLNLHIVRLAGAAIASTVTYLVVIWSTVIGVGMLSEPVSWLSLLGGLIIVTGVWLNTEPSALPPAEKQRMVPNESDTGGAKAAYDTGGRTGIQMGATVRSRTPDQPG